MGATYISKKVIAPEGSVTSRAIYNWSESESDYSGDWNTCSDVNKYVKIFEKYSREKEDEFLKKEKYEDMRNYTPKWKSNVFDLGLHHYEVWSLKKVPHKKVAPVYETKFVVSCDGKAFDTKEKAESHAKKCILDGRDNVSVSKRRILVSGSEVVSSFEKIVKEMKSKPKNVKAGSILKEIHVYYVTGCASI